MTRASRGAGRTTRDAGRKGRGGALEATRGARGVRAGRAELEAIRAELEAAVARSRMPRWTIDPDDARRSVAKLVLSLVDFVRQLLERQALRRVDEGTLTPRQIEDVGRALMELERAVRELARRFGIDPSELQLDLGPLGRLT